MSRPATRPPYPFADTVGSQIREARLARGLSVNKLSALTDVSHRHLSELEKGSNVSLLVARTAMRALGLTTLWIGEDEKLTSPPGSAGAQGTAEAAGQSELGASLIAKAVTLIRHFEANAESLDSEEQVEALAKLVQASVVPADHPARGVAVSRKRKTSA